MSKRRPLIIAAVAVPAVGAIAALSATAFAAGTTVDASTPRTPYSVQCVNPTVPAVVPPAALLNKVFTGVGVAGVSGSLPAIPSVGTITTTLASVQVTVQYYSGKTGTATLRLPGHEYHIPIQFTNPPQTKTLLLGPKSAVNYQVFVSGGATARVTVTEFLGAGTVVQSHLVAGSTCPTGETVNAAVDPKAPASPLPSASPASGSPSASPASPGASSPASPGASMAATTDSSSGLPSLIPLP